MTSMYCMSIQTLISKTDMKNELIKLADHLDKKGLHAEANYLDALIKRAEALEKRAGLTKTAGIFDSTDKQRLKDVYDMVYSLHTESFKLPLE